MLEQLLEFAKKEMGPEYVGHDFDHSIRVRRNALLIAKEETCDLMVVEASALIHDYLDHKYTTDIEGRKKILTVVLHECGLQSEQIQHVFAIIENISYSTGGVVTTIEGMIVQDADRLDALGAIGIARTFAYGGRLMRRLYGDELSSVQHFHDKLFKLKNLMNTSKGKVLAIERHEFMLMFLDQLSRELR